MKRGEIYWINNEPGVKTFGSVQGADRPGIIVSNEANNKYSNTVVVVPLTSVKKAIIPTHCYINSALKPSTALCEQVSTVDIRQLGSRVGVCTWGEMCNVDRCIAISLGLDSRARQLDPQEEVIEKLEKSLADMKEYIRQLREVSPRQSDDS